MTGQQLLPQIQIKKGILISIVVFAILVAVSWVAVALNVDINVGRLFYTEAEGWVHKDAQPWKFLYDFGTVPGLLLTLGALILFFVGFFQSRWRNYQKQLLVIVLTAILGAGLLVNAILKPYCGRPRPREIQIFDGRWEYCPPCVGSTPGQGMSFPCGHCTMGFLFVTLACFRRKSPALAYGGAVFGLVYGGLLGLTRAVQGAHFVTDTLWSLGAIVLVALQLHYYVIPWLEKVLGRWRELSPKKIALLGACTALVVAAVTVGFLTRRPYLELSSFPLEMPTHIRQLEVDTNVTLIKTTIAYDDHQPANIGIQGQGFGWTNATQQVEVKSDIQGDVLIVRVHVEEDGYFAELRHQLFLNLPSVWKDRLKVQLDQ